MGRRGPLAALLIALACGGASASSELPIREARWTTPERRVAVLSTEPGECFAPPVDLAQARRAAIGRVAFRTPLLLGGQAARAGLSCASCHRNGRGNPDFVFPGLSGAPGTADVTASLMSSYRGDGVFNPKPIPDLGSDAPKVAHANLRKFIAGLVVEEFDGPPPPVAVLDGLVTYVRALDPKVCKTPQPITMAGTFETASEAAKAAMIALDMSEPATARLMLGAARSALGRVDERLAGRRVKRERQLVRDLDTELLQIQLAVDRGDADIGNRVDAWRSILSTIGPAVGRASEHSLFNPALLARTSQAQTP